MSINVALFSDLSVWTFKYFIVYIFGLSTLATAWCKGDDDKFLHTLVVIYIWG